MLKENFEKLYHFKSKGERTRYTKASATFPFLLYIYVYTLRLIFKSFIKYVLCHRRDSWVCIV